MNIGTRVPSFDVVEHLPGLVRRGVERRLARQRAEHGGRLRGEVVVVHGGRARDTTRTRRTARAGRPRPLSAAHGADARAAPPGPRASPSGAYIRTWLCTSSSVCTTIRSPAINACWILFFVSGTTVRACGERGVGQRQGDHAPVGRVLAWSGGRSCGRCCRSAPYSASSDVFTAWIGGADVGVHRVAEVGVVEQVLGVRAVVERDEQVAAVVGHARALVPVRDGRDARR